MSKRDFLVIGASGYLGAYFIKNILKTTESRIFATYGETSPQLHNERIKWLKLDVTIKAQVDDLFSEMKKSDAEFEVIYLSAYHHPDKVEQNPEFAKKINIDALEYILDNLPNLASFYYSSSDSVYGESINNYHFKEDEAHNPLNEYGRQKSAAEKIVLAKGQNVIHYPFLIGPSLTTKPHFYDNIVRDLRDGKKLEAFADSYRSSIDFNQATLLTLQLIKLNKKLGTINISADEDLSKYDVFLRIAEKFNFDKSLIAPISISQTNNIFLAKRPASTLLDNSKIKNSLKLHEIKLSL